jgi:A/G-specific adenine glycosylase
LGYYQRARNLHQAAQHIVQYHQGVFPDTFDAVAGLPGVGRYTAGAVLCFAFGKRYPILDTNVQRVLERVFVRRQAARASAHQKRLWRMAEEILPAGTDAWVINQAMMDLGATVCTARNPQCVQCCLQVICVAAPTFSKQLGLFPYAEVDAAETDLLLVAEAPAAYGGGTPPPDFGSRAQS